MARNRNQEDKVASVITDLKVRCKCGHMVFVPHYVDKMYCT